MSIPNIVVLLAVHNGENYLSEQVESILNQVEVNLTLFVRLDNCTDSSYKIMSYYAENNKNVFLLPSEGIYGSAAANFLSMVRDCDFSGFDFISFADQDDIWFENKCSSAINTLVQTDSHGYSSNLIAFSNKKKWLLNKFGIQKKYDYLFQGASAGCTYVMSSVLIEYIKKRLLIVPVKNDKTISHDWLIYALARNGGFSWVMSNDALINYRQHESNVYSANSGLKGFIFRFDHILNGWYKKNIIKISNYLELSLDESKIINCIKSRGWFCRFYLSLSAYNFRREGAYAVILMLMLLLRVV